MASIIVIGGAGKLGRAVTEEALRRGHSVTTHVRSRAKAADLPSGVSIIEGDGRDRASLAAAIPGHDAVVVTGGGRSDPVSSDIVKAAIAAMQQAGIRRLIAVSAYGAVDPRGFYGWMLSTMTPKLASDKQQMEAALRASGLDWTAVRPPVLNDGPASGELEARAGAVLRGMPAISRADTAAFIIDEIEKPGFVGAAPVIFKRGTKTA